MTALRRSTRKSGKSSDANVKLLIHLPVPETNDRKRSTKIMKKKVKDEDVHREETIIVEKESKSSKGKRKANEVMEITTSSLKKIKATANSKKAEEDSEEENVDSVEINRLKQMLHYERRILEDERARLEKLGCKTVEEEMKNFVIVGVDEVGVGPLAGPCVSGAVALNVGVSDFESKYNFANLFGINDSKKLKSHQRESLAIQIKNHSFANNLGICTSQEVDSLNPRNASMEAMRRAVTGLLEGPLKDFRVHLLVDYHSVPGISNSIGQTCLEKGDAKSQSIAAASIIAKVFRDDYMLQLHQRFPIFGFDRNAGYGTASHMAALKNGSICPEHRLSFMPVRLAYEKIQKEKESKEQPKDQGMELVRSQSQKENELPEETEKKIKNISTRSRKRTSSATKPLRSSRESN